MERGVASRLRKRAIFFVKPLLTIKYSKPVNIPSKEIHGKLISWVPGQHLTLAHTMNRIIVTTNNR